jgi:hypothetical protein
LQVPDGTTAMVRCPACKTVFSPAAGLAPPEPEPEEERKPKKVAKTREREDEPEEKEPEEKPRRRRRPDPDDDETLSPAEKAALKAAFARAAWGCKLIWVSFMLFMLSMLVIVAFWFNASWQAASKMDVPQPTFIIVAGAIGIFTWITAAVGVGLCLSGPPTPGHLGYGIAAAVATGMHLLMLVILVSQGTDYSVAKEAEPDGPSSATAKMGLIPTRLDAVAFYITLMVYKDEAVLPKGKMTLSIVVGVMEMIRNLLILMLVSCLARAAGDEELAGKCTRAAGAASFGPSLISVAMLLFAVAMIETDAQSTTFGKIMIATVRMWTYAIFLGTTLPALVAARETADACDEPYQSQIPQL